MYLTLSNNILSFSASKVKFRLIIAWVYPELDRKLKRINKRVQLPVLVCWKNTSLY